MINTIKCKNCGTNIEITQALLDEARAELEPTLRHEAIQKAQEKFELDMKEMEIKLKQKEEKVEEMKNREIKLLEAKGKLEEEKRELDLKVARSVEEKTKQAYEKAFKFAQEQFTKKEQEIRLHQLELLKQNEMLKKDLAEAHRKANVTSQQLQGEILEIEVEDMLRKMFPQDQIIEIAKGINGSDVRHIIKSPLGANCGMILWECKRTKNWSMGWISKLKADLRAEKADIPVIVTTILPKDLTTSVGMIDGVYVCEFSYAAFLAKIIRDRIIAVARQKAISANRESKAERLYNYVTSNEFKEQLKFMFESYKTLKDQIDRERKIYEKNWKEREIHLEQLVKNTTSVYATIAAELGTSMPVIEEFELKALASGK